MSTSIDFETKRQVADIQSKVASLDHRARAATLRRPGGLVARSALCHVLGHLQGKDADDIARELFGTDRDLDRLLVLRAVVNPANTTIATWAAELTQTLTADIAERLIPESAYAQLRNAGIAYELGRGAIKVPTWSPTASGGFIIEGGPIPVAAFVFGSTTLAGKKAASIIAVSDEMLLGATSDVEQALRTILGESLGLTIDAILLGNTAAAAAAPAGLLNGLTPLTATAGGGATALLGDVKKLIAAISPALKPVLLANSVQTASIAVLAQAPLPIITAPTMPADQVIAVDAAAFASATGVPSFRASQNVTLHMDTVPSALSATGSPNVVSAPMRSAFQTDVTALRSILPIDWGLRRAGAVAVINGTTW